MSDVKSMVKNQPNQLSATNAFTAAGSELAGSALPILKLSKAGQWVSGAENTPVSETRFAADVLGAQRGFVCFIDGNVVDEIMVPVVLGKAISPDQLPDHGPYPEGDGWAPSASIQLRSIETGDEFVFKPTSQGGRAAIGVLLTKYGNRLDVGKNGIPIVDLGVTSYEHKRYGVVFKPMLKVVSWRDEADLANGAAPKLDDTIPF